MKIVEYCESFKSCKSCMSISNCSTRRCHLVANGEESTRGRRHSCRDVLPRGNEGGLYAIGST